MQLQPFFEWLLRTTLQASLLICLIFLFQAVLRNKLGARWHYCLWLLLLIRMAMPWAPQSRVSVFNLIPQSLPQRQTEYIQQDVGDDAVSSDAASPSTAESTPVSTTEVVQDTSKAITVAPETGKETESQLKPLFSRAADILPLVWLTGALALAVYVCANNFNLLRIVKRERPLTDQKILDLLEDCKAEMGIRIILGVVATDKVKSPALFGFIRPRLLLPAGMLEALSPKELRHVFLHELAHLKRHDIYIGWLMSLLQVLHWFNPLIWLAFYRVRTDRELACDALVLARTQSGQAKDYGRTIVSLLERFSRSQRLPAMAGILETKAQLKRRIIMIARFKKNSYQWSLWAIVLIIILACISLPDARRTKASGISATKHITLRQVWSGTKVDLLGGTSPDGRYLSYVDWETGDLAIYEIATGNKRRLTDKGTWNESDEFAMFSRWSPDGKQIVYDWYTKNNSHLRVVGIDGSKPRILYRNDEVKWIETYDWSPDGKHILAWFERNDGTTQIVLVSVADGSVRILKTHNLKWIRNMCFSPDSRYIVYSYRQKEDSLNLDISVMPVDGSHEIPLIQHPAHDFVLGWAPDGKNILFASDRTGTLGAWLIAVEDGKPQGESELIKPDIGRLGSLGFTKDGSFYYGISRGSDDVYIATLDQQTGKILTPQKKVIERHEGSNVAAAYSPDGKYLAYIYQLGFVAHNRSRQNILCIRSLETGKEREFPVNLNFITRSSSPRWSPNGRSVIVTGSDNKDYVAYEIDIKSGEVNTLVQSHSCEWARDGKAVVYMRPDAEAKKMHILLRDLETGTEEEIYKSTGKDYSPYNMRISPDGQWLAVRCIRPTSIKILPVSGGEPQTLPNFEKLASGHKSIAWTPDSNFIIFPGDVKEGRHPLYRISRESGKAEKLGLLMNRYYGLDVHPNGQRILVSGSESASESEVWVMENFLPGAPVAKPEPAVTLRKIEHEWGGFASLSPDGRYMCDVDWDVEETERLVLRELATGRERSLTTTGHPEYSAISRASTQVAYLWYDRNWEMSSLCTIGLDGSGRRFLRRDDCLIPIDWSADDKEILAIQFNKDPKQLVWVSAVDGSIRQIKSMGKGDFGKFEISPDGRFVIYDRPQSNDSSKRDIFLFDLREDREIALIEHPANDRLLGWTPDGKSIFFASDRTGTWDGWLQRVADGEPQGFPQLVRQSIGDVTPIGFAQGGSFYYQTGGKPMRDVFIATLDLDKGEVLASPMPVRQTGASHFGDWSPDGRKLAYCTRRPEGSQIIVIRDLATGEEREIDTELPQFLFTHWSADGRSILGATGREPPHLICKIDVQTGERTDLVRSTTGRLGKCELFPDGKTLLYVRDDPNSKTRRFVVRNLTTGREEDLIRAKRPVRLRGFALSPDKQRLVYVTSVGSSVRSQALKIVPAAGGEPRELLQFDESEKMWLMSLAWTPDSQDVLFIKWLMGDKGGELWRISAQGGEPRKVWAWKKPFTGLCVHPDGQRIAFHTRTAMNETWVMENFLPTGVSQAK